MSARTFEADRAIREAWKKERELILQGKGTRQWTPEQQEDIFNTGKAHDENGYAFEGHHMLSVAKDPVAQGDPGNIQFLSKTEHLDAHGGNYQNLTNGYYDPFTGETKEFGEKGFEPCEVIELSTPVFVDENSPQKQAYSSIQKDEIIKSETSKNRPQSLRDKITKKVDNFIDRIIDFGDYLHSSKFKEDAKQFGAKKWHGLCEFGMNVLENYFNSLQKENEEKNTEKESMTNSINTGYGEFRSSDYPSFMYSFNESGGSQFNYSDEQQAEEDFADEDTVNDGRADALLKEKKYPDERESPIEHTVSGYDRIVRGKKIHVESYTRGGKKKRKENQENAKN